MNLCRIDKFLKEYIIVILMKVFFKKKFFYCSKVFFLVLKLKFRVFDILMIMGLLLFIYFKSIFFYFLIDVGVDVINSRDKVKLD